MTTNQTPDTTTSAGCAEILTGLRRQLHAQEMRAREIEAERGTLALAAAMARPEALAKLRDLGEELTLLGESGRNIKSAIIEAERLQAEAEAREALERKAERWDRGAELRAKVITLAGDIDDGFRALAEIVRRHDEAAQELIGLGLLSESAQSHLAGALGVPGALLAAGLGSAFPMVKPISTDARPLAASHRAMIGLPSRERFMEAMP